MVKAMFLSNGQVIVTIPSVVVTALKIEKGDGIDFDPGISPDQKLSYFMRINKGEYKNASRKRPKNFNQY